MHGSENELTCSPHGSRLSHLHRSSTLLLFVQELCNPRFFCATLLLLWLLTECLTHAEITTYSIWTPIRERACVCVCGGKKRRGLLACRTGVVCFVSKMSICLCKVIPYDLPKYTGLGCPSGWQLRAHTPPPLTPTTASPGLEVLPFYLPLRGYEKADKAFHSLLLLSDFWISVILKWLQHVYSGLVAP